MQNFAKILTYLELTGLVLGVLGTLFTLVVYHIDSTWQKYMPENELVLAFPRTYFTRINDGGDLKLHKDDHGYEFLRNIYETQARITKFDGIAFLLMAFLLLGALGHIFCSILNTYFRERMERHKSINKFVAFITVISSLSLLYTLMCSNHPYDSYIEKTFYSENKTQILVNFEPEIHWPCYLFKENSTQERFINDEGLIGPHMCQYKLYKIISVVLFLCYAVISVSIIHLISREQMNRLIGMVEDRLSPERRRLPCPIRRTQVANGETEAFDPSFRRRQDSNATLISGNINVHPSQCSSSPTIDLDDTDDVPNDNGSPPPPYPASNQQNNSVMPLSIISASPVSTVQVVDNTGQTVAHLSVLSSIPNEPPPSYSSTVVNIRSLQNP